MSVVAISDRVQVRRLLVRITGLGSTIFPSAVGMHNSVIDNDSDVQSCLHPLLVRGSREWHE